MASRSWLDKQVSYRTVMRLVGILFLAELGGVWALNTSGALALYLSIGFVVFAAIFEFLSFTDKKTLVATASTAATPIASMSQTKDPYRICEQLLKKNLVQGTGAILVCAKK